MYYLKNIKFTTHNGMTIETDENGDVSRGYYDILNWQLDDNGEVAFVKIGEYTFTDSKFELVMRKNATIFWNTESSEVGTLTSYFVYIRRVLHFHTGSGTMEYQTPRVGHSKSTFPNTVNIFSI